MRSIHLLLVPSNPRSWRATLRRCRVSDTAMTEHRSPPRRHFLRYAALASLVVFASCQTIPTGMEQARLASAQRIQAESPGDYFIGRRYYRKEFHFWGYIRRPGQPWSTAQLVVLNERQKLAPDRAELRIGSDSNYEYRLKGHFTGDKVYELVSNRFLPEFVLGDYEVISTNPPPIFASQLPGGEKERLKIEQPL